MKKIILMLLILLFVAPAVAAGNCECPEGYFEKTNNCPSSCECQKEETIKGTCSGTNCNCPAGYSLKEETCDLVTLPDPITGKPILTQVGTCTCSKMITQEGICLFISDECDDCIDMCNVFDELKLGICLGIGSAVKLTNQYCSYDVVKYGNWTSCLGNYLKTYECKSGMLTEIFSDDCSDCSCKCGNYDRTEICDNKDNDCDGITDSFTAQCGTNVGECVKGVKTCTAGTWSACVGEIKPAEETCNNLDDDCDGTTDEGINQTCGTDTGECVKGIQTCTSGEWDPCSGTYVGPAVEICDSKDNDCDGVTDEDLTRTCMTTCGTGTETCNNGMWAACTAQQPVSEICNDKTDNDCDGKTDGLDDDCSVEITGITVSDNNPKEYTKITVECSANPPSMNCIEVLVGSEQCLWKEGESYWNGNTAVFTGCEAGSRGTKTVTCYVNTEKCAQENNEDQTTSMAITVQASPCSDYASETTGIGEYTCETDPNCEWCEECSGKKDNGLGESKCINSGDCKYSCNKNSECGAACSEDDSGCEMICDLNDACYSGTYRDYQNPGCDDTCECDQCNSYTEKITDNDNDTYDVECDADCDDTKNAVHPGAQEICGDGVDNDCQGNDEQSNCCELALTEDLNLDSAAIIAKNYYEPDKIRDYYWDGTMCAYAEKYDYCLTGTQLVEYYSAENYYGSETIECNKTCEGQTKELADFEMATLILYTGECSEGACTAAEIGEECNSENVLTEYYCEGKELKSTTKDCDDYDGYYETVNGREYVDYSCQQGVCKPYETTTQTDLNQGQVKVIIKNMGTTQFQGSLELTVNNFCPGEQDITIIDIITLGLHEKHEKTYDFVTQCTPVKYSFICKNEPTYGTTCQFWPGTGCGIFTHSEIVYETCETCCENTLTTVSEQECSQTTSCQTSEVRLKIKNSENQVVAAESTDKANWCCKT